MCYPRHKNEVCNWGALYYPLGNSPKTFQELCEQYYTSAKALFAVKATWEWKNEIDCLLNFSMRHNGLSYDIDGKAKFYPLYEKLLDEMKTE